MENTTRTFQLGKDYDCLTQQHGKAAISRNDFIVKWIKIEIETTKEALYTWSDASKKTYKEKYRRVCKKLSLLENELSELK